MGNERANQEINMPPINSMRFTNIKILSGLNIYFF